MTPFEQLRLDAALFAIGCGAVIALALMLCGDLVVCAWSVVRDVRRIKP